MGTEALVGRGEIRNLLNRRYRQSEFFYASNFVEPDATEAKGLQGPPGPGGLTRIRRLGLRMGAVSYQLRAESDNGTKRDDQVPERNRRHVPIPGRPFTRFLARRAPHNPRYGLPFPQAAQLYASHWRWRRASSPR